ncbi:DUF421 domain-containing protein [Pedobacter sp. SYSU D00535]|uniref:DUF421 domain-containing protein n=1 Tax=Pedobacter sp. SYSU D00535 TaxID=2810308 RepID=UPI001A9611E3|nr:YetF domain-containing protein [Pedobacter sp. SYSU D00535]
MKEFEIYIMDWSRMLFGEAPVSFIIEVIIRAFFVYLLLMVSMRIMGKRMASHLSRNELIAMVSLAAAIGVPMMDPSRGILPAFVIAIVVVIVQRIISTLAFKSQKFEQLAEDDLSILVSDGKLQLDEMKKSRISPERLFAEARSCGIDNLGKIKRLYLESGGAFSFIQNDQPSPGLSTLPQYDTDFRKEKKLAPGFCACNECGNVKRNQPGNQVPCERCGRTKWVEAYL